MSVAINGENGEPLNKDQYDSEFDETPTVGDEDEVHEHGAHHSDGCGFTCSPLSYAI